MTLFGLILVIALVGFICWLVLQIPMPAPFKNIIMGLVCVLLVLWILQQFGLATDLRLPRLR